MRKGKFYIGTSGWYYDHWKGTFYPFDKPAKDYLNYYQEVFSTVEINRTFYQIPSKKVFLNYAKNAPSSFIFSIKASRFITHVKYLKVSKRSLTRLFSAIDGLGKHLGPILFQLPPNWRLNLERLEAFLQKLPKGYRYVIEFRNPTWWSAEVYALLRKHHVSFCIFDLGKIHSPKEVTANFVYVRFHGPKKAYGGKYSPQTLKKWAQFFHQMSRKGKDVYCYFNNDEAGFAATNAKMMSSYIQTN